MTVSAIPLKFQSVLIVIATYNELENLPRLVLELFDLLPDSTVLVIDDASPDGTGAWCDSARETYPKLEVLHRTGKLGLGSAALTGLRSAIERNFEFVATLDADFSHDPRNLLELLNSVNRLENQNIGVAIGSRYVSGGRIEGWPWYRKIVSRVVNMYSRRLLSLPTQDNSGALRVYRISSLKKIDLEKVHSEGYGYLEEILYLLRRAGVAMTELPITFRDRERGKSKTSLMAGIAVFWRITLLGMKR